MKKFIIVFFCLLLFSAGYLAAIKDTLIPKIGGIIVVIISVIMILHEKKK